MRTGSRGQDLGTGRAGLAGVAALSRGYRVTFSDICLQAVQVARANARGTDSSPLRRWCSTGITHPR